MPKSGLEINKLQPFLQNSANSNGWALCVGAGISEPIFPNWKKLVQQLISLEVGGEEALVLAERLLNIFSADAVIQASQERLGLSNKDFAAMLVKELYRLVSDNLTASEFTLFTRCLISHASDLTRAQWRAFLDIIRTKFPHVTALQIAIVLNQIIESDLSPIAVLSFNAESLLPALINAVYREGLPGKRAPTNKQANGKKILDIVTHSISSRRRSRMPYIFCHGLLPVPQKKTLRRQTQSIDKLVFSESDYLQLTNATFAWQSSAFFDICVSRSVVFLGVSLSDSDMRRWLSLVHANRLNELKLFHSFSGPSTTHYWIRKAPDNSKEKPWIESLVSHLGIRLVWIDKWCQAGEALRKLLGIGPPIPTYSHIK